MNSELSICDISSILSKTTIFIIVYNLLVLFQLLSLDFTTFFAFTISSESTKTDWQQRVCHISICNNWDDLKQHVQVLIKCTWILRNPRDRCNNAILLDLVEIAAFVVLKRCSAQDGYSWLLVTSTWWGIHDSVSSHLMKTGWHVYSPYDMMGPCGNGHCMALRESHSDNDSEWQFYGYKWDTACRDGAT